MEKILRQSLEFAENIINTVREPLIVLDQDFRVVTVNRSFYDFFQVKPEETVGQLIYDLGNKQWDIPKLRELLETILPQKTSFDGYEVEHNFATIGRRTMLLNARQIEQVMGNERIILLAIEDITERKKAESELRKLEKLESVGTLAGGIAHDFNNALTGLYGNLALAKMKLANDHPGFRFLEAAEQSILRTTLLTSRLLTFAKGGDPVTKSLSLVSPIEEVVNLSLSGSNVKPVITSADNLWQVRVDQRQIEQVFANLTVNAREAMPDGGHLYITMENAELADKAEHGLIGGKYLRISMTDEGTGIAPDLLDKIFDPYFTTKEMGSGLGLATAYSIIDKHGGHISVTSRLGNGTTFTIYLPAASVTEPSLDRSEPPSASQDKIFKVLVMDDEAIIRNMLNEMLEKLGFAVETAVDGKQAIEMYLQAKDASNPFDVVILDLTVPGGMGGEEAAKGLLQVDPEVRIIVSSGYGDDPVMANYADYSFKGMVPKPYTPGKVSEELSRVLGNA